MKFVVYEFTYNADREVLSKVVTHDDPRRPEFNAEIVMDAGMDPDDERIWVSCLAEPWGPHRSGAVVVCEDADTGRFFAIEQPDRDIIIHGQYG